MHYFSNYDRIIVILVALIMLFILSACSQPEPPSLLLSENSWDFGKVSPDQQPSHDIVLKNEGEQKLIIESVYSSCGCVINQLEQKELTAGEETILKITFNPYGYEGKVSKYVVIKSNDPENPEQRIDVSIDVKHVPNPDASISSQTLDLGAFSQNELKKASFTISNHGDADLVITEIVLEDFIQHNLTIPLTIAPGEEFDGELILDGRQMKTGEFRKAIRIMTNDPQKAMLFLRLKGKVE